MSVPWTAKDLKTGSLAAADEFMLLDSSTAVPADINKRVTLSNIQSGLITNVNAQNFNINNLSSISIRDVDTNTFTISSSVNLTADRVLNLPLLGANDTFVFESFAQSLTNKIFTGTGNSFNNTSLRVSGSDADLLTILPATLNGSDRNVSFPSLSGDDTFALLNIANTFTQNQTFSGDASFSSPVLFNDNIVDFSWKIPVRVATTTSGVLIDDFNTDEIIDGVILDTDDRILIKDQTSAQENGIYTVNPTGGPTRSIDMATGSDATSAALFVSEGTVNAGSGFEQIDFSGAPVGIVNLTFVQFTGSGFVKTLTFVASDEDSALSTGLLYTTEAAAFDRPFSVSNLVLSLKNAPTVNVIEVNILQETGTNSNAFTTIFSVRPTIDVGEFTSQTAATSAVLTTTTWTAQRRLQIELTVTDVSITGLKVTI